MNGIFESGIELDKLVASIRAFVENRVLTIQALAQFGVVLLCLGAGFVLARPFQRVLQERTGSYYTSVGLQGRFLRSLGKRLPYAMASILLWIMVYTAIQLEFHHELMRLVAILLMAWVVIRLLSSIIVNRFWSKMTALAIWIWAALAYAGLADPLAGLLGEVAFHLGEVRISLLTIGKALVLLLVLLKVADWTTGLADRRLDNTPSLTPSARVMLSKLIKVAVLALAIFIPLESLGLNLSALAVFGGAVGVGLGFGLQKVVGNLISGFILLMDKSIKPGDVIEVGNVWGWISSLSARYASVVTRDGSHYLVPNEDLITNQVINWSYGDPNIRMKIKVGVSYNSDLKLAMKLMLDAAKGRPRVLEEMEPVCQLIEFGDSSVNLELRFWINDPQNGIANIKSDIMLDIWDAFHAHNIEIPFPQRDLHIKSYPKEKDASGGRGSSPPPDPPDDR